MRWSWHGIVALILAVFVGGGYCATLVITAYRGGPVTDGGAALLNNLGGMLAGALAGWIGGSAVAVEKRNRRDGDDGGDVSEHPHDSESDPD